MIYACQGKRGERWRSRVESLLHPVPLLGTARKYLALSRLASALEALIGAGVSIVKSWELAGDACGSPRLQREISGWKDRSKVAPRPPTWSIKAPVFPKCLPIFTAPPN